MLSAVHVATDHESFCYDQLNCTCSQFACAVKMPEIRYFANANYIF